MTRWPTNGRKSGVRRVVTGALEIERAEKRIGSSLQSHPVVHTTQAYLDVMSGLDGAEITITSDITHADPAPVGAFAIEEVAGVSVVCSLADGEKCGRCYKFLPDVRADAASSDLCGRCLDAITLTRQWTDLI